MSWREQAAAHGAMAAGFRSVLIWMDQGMGQEELRSRIVESMRELAESLPVPDSGPATSKAAAKSVRAGSLRARVLQALRVGGLTDEEVGLAMGHPRIWPRCSELRAMGLIAPNGETRLVARTGQQADVCALTEAGRAVLGAIDGVSR